MFNWTKPSEILSIRRWGWYIPYILLFMCVLTLIPLQGFSESKTFVLNGNTFYEEHYVYIWIGITFLFLQGVGLAVLSLILRDRNILHKEVAKRRTEVIELRNQMYKERSSKPKKSCEEIDKVFDSLASALQKMEEK